jgi:hypothetical protein
MHMSPELERLAKRAALNINISYFPGNSILRESFFRATPRDTGSTVCATPAEATASYLRLVSTLETTGTTSPVEPAAAVLPSPPEGGM